LTAIAAVFYITSAAAQTPVLLQDPYRSTWFFSAAEIGAAYQYQENYGSRVRNPLPAQGCLFGKADFAASYRQISVRVPCQFIDQASRQVKELLDIGADVIYFRSTPIAHLAVPLQSEKIQRFPVSIVRGFVAEPQLVSPYRRASRSRCA
jgi:hypothetical protein